MTVEGGYVIMCKVNEIKPTITKTQTKKVQWYVRQQRSTGPLSWQEDNQHSYDAILSAHKH